ncbi:hypothetical protein [Amycolatopsis sp. NPDC004625]|uniref:hypothetical protein n=1 Tax=Amycolatopsis sp. NPDC004625 TaxID=3154670 RepID=UPI0033AB77E3
MVSPLFFLGDDALTSGRAGEPALVPAGYTFAIWAVICVLGAAWGVWQLFPSSRGDAAGRRVAWPLAGVFAGFTGWLVITRTGPVWGTVVVFAAMLVLLLIAMRRLAGDRTSTPGKVLLRCLLGVYAGWSSVAVWVNLTTVLADYGLVPGTRTGLVIQIAALFAAVVTVTLVILRRGPHPAYVGAVGWALAGAAIGASSKNAVILTVLATIALAAVLILAATLIGRHPGNRNVHSGA